MDHQKSERYSQQQDAILSAVETGGDLLLQTCKMTMLTGSNIHSVLTG